MYDVKDWAEVHRLFHREGVAKARIARMLGMSRNTVAASRRVVYFGEVLDVGVHVRRPRVRA